MSTRPGRPHEAAFGATPGAHPLATGGDEHRWWRAVALGGQGRFAAAARELGPLVGAADAVLGSLALSTAASHRRQLGDHRAARRLDARALVRLLDDPAVGGGTALAGPRGATALADALVGLAADGLGQARTAAARALLARAAGPTAVAHPRCAVRHAWVLAETALVADARDEAHEHADRAVRLAAVLPSVRHRVKSRLVLAAASPPGAAREHADGARRAAREHGLVPLERAAVQLLLALPGPAVGDDVRSALHRRGTECDSIITQRGGRVAGARC